MLENGPKKKNLRYDPSFVSLTQRKAPNFVKQEAGEALGFIRLVA